MKHKKTLNRAFFYVQEERYAAVTRMSKSSHVQEEGYAAVT